MSSSNRLMSILIWFRRKTTDKEEGYEKWMLMGSGGSLTMSLSSVLAGSESVFNYEFDPAQGDEALQRLCGW